MACTLLGRWKEEIPALKGYLAVILLSFGLMPISLLTILTKATTTPRGQRLRKLSDSSLSLPTLRLAIMRWLWIN
jgi:hypothetical protein